MLDSDSQIESVTEPYLSLVVAARNDDHGGNLLGRMQIFVDGWLAQARRYQIPSELTGGNGYIAEPPDLAPAVQARRAGISAGLPSL